MTGNEQYQAETACLHAIVDGSVQGVGFRMFVQEHAQSMGLTGWVRNKFDGRVEVMAEGPRYKLEQLVEKLRLGPRSAYVTELQNEWFPANREFVRFEVRRTE
jgi:acylphosphatase